MLCTRGRNSYSFSTFLLFLKIINVIVTFFSEGLSLGADEGF
jgi:hypothetical protein